MCLFSWESIALNFFFKIWRNLIFGVKRIQEKSYHIMTCTCTYISTCNFPRNNYSTCTCSIIEIDHLLCNSHGMPWTEKCMHTEKATSVHFPNSTVFTMRISNIYFHKYHERHMMPSAVISVKLQDLDMYALWVWIPVP